MRFRAAEGFVGVEIDAGLLPGLADGSFLQVLALLHKARRRAPQPALGLVRTLADQQSLWGVRHAHDQDPRVVILHARAP